MTAAPADFSPVTVEEFLAAYPEFKELEESAVQFQLDLENMDQNKSAWKRYWRFAVILATGHALALDYDISAGLAASGKKNPIEAGVVTSQSAGPSSLSESRSLASWMTGDDILDSNYGRTTYGQRYLTLLIRVIPPAGVVYSPPIGSAGACGPGYRSRVRP